MSVTSAIKNGSISEIVEAVEAAVKVYPAAKPSVPTINTAFGDMKLDNAMLDDESRILEATKAAAYIAIAVERLPDDATKEIEIAKLIASNATLRNIGAATSGGLL